MLGLVLRPLRALHGPLRALGGPLRPLGRPLHTPAILPAAATPLTEPAAENWRLRQHLALSYRLLDQLQLNEGSCNHLSVMAPARAQPGEVGTRVLLVGFQGFIYSFFILLFFLKVVAEISR